MFNCSTHPNWWNWFESISKELLIKEDVRNKALMQLSPSIQCWYIFYNEKHSFWSKPTRTYSWQQFNPVATTTVQGTQPFQLGRQNFEIQTVKIVITCTFCNQIAIQVFKFRKMQTQALYYEMIFVFNLKAKCIHEVQWSYSCF